MADARTQFIEAMGRDRASRQALYLKPTPWTLPETPAKNAFIAS
jgi:hypothetical protein